MAYFTTPPSPSNLNELFCPRLSRFGQCLSPRLPLPDLMFRADPENRHLKPELVTTVNPARNRTWKKVSFIFQICHKSPTAVVSLSEQEFLKAMEGNDEVMSDEFIWDALIVGGGLAGLTAAARLSKLGRKALILEAGAELGGRGRTQEQEGGYLFNLGGHALYRTSSGARILNELGVRYTGACPATKGNFVAVDGGLAALPSGPLSIFTSRLFRNVREKTDALKGFVTIMATSPKSLRGQSVSEWLGTMLSQQRPRDFFAALIRLVSYVKDTDTLCAEAALEQLKFALTGNVLYLDDGWGSLVRSLEEIIESQGGVIRCNEAVTSLHKAEFFEVKTRQRSFRARTVILACPPEKAHALIKGFQEPSWSVPKAVIASCLDLALTHVPDPKKSFVLGVDEPSYLSVHTKYAKLAPGDGAVLHCMYYGGPEGKDPGEIRKRLEALLDKAQAGWREALVHQRFLPRLRVAGGLPEAAGGGFRGRPKIHERTKGLFLCGDWVGDEGQLADASFASGEKAALEAAAVLDKSLCGAS